MGAEIQGAADLRRVLTRDMQPAVLTALVQPVLEAAERLAAAAAGSTPRHSGGLAASQFVDGPQTKNETVGATTGYEAHYAAAEHEGFHFGRRTSVPPKWLERAARDGVEGRLAESASAAIWDALQRFRR